MKKYIKKLIFCLLMGFLGFLLLGLGYDIFIGKPITLNHFYSMRDVSYMEISIMNNDRITLKSKELSKGETDKFLELFDPYKIYKPFFKKPVIDEQDYYHINIRLFDDSKEFITNFIITDQGGIFYPPYTFYPYNVKHEDMYNYLSDLLGY